MELKVQNKFLRDDNRYKCLKNTRQPPISNLIKDYKQIAGAVMKSPICPIISNIFTYFTIVKVKSKRCLLNYRVIFIFNREGFNSIFYIRYVIVRTNDYSVSYVIL